MSYEVSKYELMRHALGVQPYSGGRWSKPYRNHFVAGGDNRAVWDGLVTDGFARKSSDGSELTGGHPCYVVTEIGREKALAGLSFKQRWGRGTPENA